MLSPDNAAASPPPEKTGDAESHENETPFLKGLEENVEKATEIEPPEMMWGNERPFYNRPSQLNRRLQPLRKWFVAGGFLMAAVCGYLLGLNQRPSAPGSSPPHLAKMHELPDPPRAEPPPMSDLHHAETPELPDPPSAEPHHLSDLPHVETPELPDPPRAEPSSPPVTKNETEMVALKGGGYSMGDAVDGLRDAKPHQVSLAPFMMSKYEVTLELWDSVMLWARDHGYPDLPSGSGKASNHPVYDICWIDAVKWCNARSEKEGLAPCYYVEAARQTVMREGISDIDNRQVNWGANGYRLPTEAEWEYAARGGLAGKRFPWGDEITHAQANYHGSALIEYDKGQLEGTATSLISSMPYTAAVGSFQPNGFGLHDMTGNVAEWCWDFYAPSYETALPHLTNPHGPDSGTNCVVRGGSWRHTAADARCANRFNLPGDLAEAYIGFRVVRGL